MNKANKTPPCQKTGVQVPDNLTVRASLRIRCTPAEEESTQERRAKKASDLMVRRDNPSFDRKGFVTVL
jgi:hypothetical protein